MRQTGHRREILLKHLDIVLITTITLFLSPPGQPYGRTDKEEDTTDLSKNQTLEGAESKAWNLLRKRTQDLLDTRKCLFCHCSASHLDLMFWMWCVVVRRSHSYSDSLSLFFSLPLSLSVTCIIHLLSPYHFLCSTLFSL